MAQEIAPLGIRSTIIQPSTFRTDFLDGSSARYGKSFIREYDEAGSQFKSWLDAMSHHQIGDPRKLADALIEIERMPEPPVRIALGSDALQWAEENIRNFSGEVDRLRAISLSTDF